MGVHVVEVVTGIVKTDIITKGGSGPPDELYAPIKKHIDDFFAKEMRGAVSADAYARRVVRQVMKSSPPKEIWDGKDAGLMRIIDGWFPRWIKVSIVRD